MRITHKGCRLVRPSKPVRRRHFFFFINFFHSYFYFYLFQWTCQRKIGEEGCSDVCFCSTASSSSSIFSRFQRRAWCHGRTITSHKVFCCFARWSDKFLKFVHAPENKWQVFRKKKQEKKSSSSRWQVRSVSARSRLSLTGRSRVHANHGRV